HRALPALRFLLSLGQLVLVLAEVEEASDRGRRHRSHLDEVEAFLLRHLESSRGGHDAQLVALIIDHPNLWDPDHLVDAQVSTDGAFPLERGRCHGHSEPWQCHGRAGRRGTIAQGQSGRRAADSAARRVASSSQPSVSWAASFDAPRRRRVAVRASTSRSPRTSMYGIFCSLASRILFCMRLSESSTSTRRRPWLLSSVASSCPGSACRSAIGMTS